MRLYMSKQSRNELLALLRETAEALRDPDITEEARIKLIDAESALSGALTSPLLPTGLVRNLLWPTFLVAGIAGFFMPYPWLLTGIPTALLFSPRLIGELSHGLGRLLSINRQPHR